MKKIAFCVFRIKHRNLDSFRNLISVNNQFWKVNGVFNAQMLISAIFLIDIMNCQKMRLRQHKCRIDI
ncbi:MAG TPA: hypothetical protein DHV48_11680 [Prolixibacteraceae bacterium]|nr:hypothetical protein [Prolixibacteraceae bacterium]